MLKHFIVVCYDIPNDKRRSKLFKKLHDFGSPVQYSVFECLVTDREEERMQRVIRSIIKPRLDHVRYYHLCATCQGKIETTLAGKEVAHEPESIVV